MSDGERGERPRRRRPSSNPAVTPVDQSDGAPSAWLDDEGGLADPGGDLVNIGFIGAALRRSKRMWLSLGLVGLLLGIALSVLRPAAPQASTTLLLTVGPEGQPGTAILTDQAMAGSRGVAAAAIRKLGLHETADDLLGSYKAVALTDRILRITVSASTDAQAVVRADAIAAAFLTFRASQLDEQQRLQFAALDDAVGRGEQRLASIETRLAQVSAKPSSAARHAALTKLQGARSQALSELNALQNQVESTKADAEQTTAAMVGQSKVLDTASPVPQSHLKPLVLFGGAGLVVGLFLGAAIAIVRSLVSDRLRRRDDVSRALGAPVRLSVPGRPLGWRPVKRGAGGAGDDAGVQRIVAFLGTVLATECRGGALAVVPVDDPRVAATCVMKLAASLAQTGSHVMVADLCGGAPAARVAGVSEPGTHTVQFAGADVDVLVPAPDDIAPTGPLDVPPRSRESASRTEPGPVGRSSGVLLSLVALDPSLPGDHLRSWASEAVVVVTAGRSSWTRIHAVGELIRLAGTRLVSAILVGADKWDESLGVRAGSGGRRAPTTSAHGGSEYMSLADPTVLRQTGMPEASTS